MVSSTTSSSEAESSSHESFRRKPARTQPPQVKQETEVVTSPPPAVSGTPAPPSPFQYAASTSVSPLPLTASDTSLFVPGLDLSSDNPILQQLTTSASGIGIGQGLSVTSVLPPPPPSTSITLQIGAAPRGSADLWRNRYYTLAQHTLHWVREASETRDIATVMPSEEQLLRRSVFLPHWPAGTDITRPFQPLAASLFPYYFQLADESIEPEFL